jgi:hypothetical protein
MLSAEVVTVIGEDAAGGRADSMSTVAGLVAAADDQNGPGTIETRTSGEEDR